MPGSDYYPLAVGNTWTYKLMDGRTFTITVSGVDGATFKMFNSLMNTTSNLRKEGGEYLTDGYEPGKWLVMLKDDLKSGDTWQVTFTANGIETILIYTVKEAGTSREVEGRTYKDVVFIDAESRMSMNGTPILMKFSTQYYYAKGVGLVLTTASGDSMPLMEYELK